MEIKHSIEMLRLFITFHFVCGLLSAVSDSEWIAFKEEHGKSYGLKEDIRRRMIFEKNVKKIRAHNAKYVKGESTFFLGKTPYADKTRSEFVKTMIGTGFTKEYVHEETPVNTSLPVIVDWRTKGYVTPVRNQTECGSSYAFSATGSLEGQHFRKTGKLVPLSQSNLIDCSGAFHNFGCDGGKVTNAFDYIIANNGIDTEASYPFFNYTMNCKFNSSNVGATMTSYKRIKTGSESDLQEAVATIGPVSATIDALHDPFVLYKGGIYSESQCSSSSVNAATLVVGYGVYKGSDYWLLKLSLGATWGTRGYMMMPRNKNNYCGVATEAAYPIV